MGVAWHGVPLGLRRVVGRWLCKTPRLIRTVPVQCGMSPCLAQIGPRIFMVLKSMMIGVYDETGQRLATWRFPRHTPEYTEPFSLAVSANDELMVLDYAERRIKVFRTDGTLLRRFGHFDTMGWMCTVPHNDRVLVVEGARMHVFRQSDGVCLQTWTLDLQSAGLCLAPDGKTALVSTWNPDGISAWRVADGRLVHWWDNATCGPRTFELPQGIMLWRDCLVVSNARKITVLRQCDGRRLLVLTLPEFNQFFPCELFITRAGHLWVAAAHSSEVFVFDLRVE